jgi:hypothetical protein
MVLKIYYGGAFLSRARLLEGPGDNLLTYNCLISGCELVVNWLATDYKKYTATTNLRTHIECTKTFNCRREMLEDTSRRRSFIKQLLTAWQLLKMIPRFSLELSRKVGVSAIHQLRVVLDSRFQVFLPCLSRRTGQ